MKIVVLMLTVFISCPIFSQGRSMTAPSWDKSETKNETIVFHFRNVSSKLDLDYMDNYRMVEILKRTLSDVSNSDLLDNIIITGTASPDGFSARNERLATERALEIKNFISRNYPVVSRNRILVRSMGEDWDGLRRMIEDDVYMPGRNEALRILNLSLSGDEMRRRLRALNSGRTYKYLLDNIFPQLRGGVACLIYFLPERESRTHLPKKETMYQPVENDNWIDFPEIEDDYLPVKRENKVQTPQSDANHQPAANMNNYSYSTNPYNYNTPQRRDNRTVNYTTRYNSLYDEDYRYEKTLFSLKTNLLFDAATAINVELEIPLDKSWSLAGEYVFPWWLNEEKQNAFQLITGSLELRRWFGNRDYLAPLTGWFGGFSLGGGYYDFERQKKGYQGEFFVPRLSLGYAHEISRNGRWRMEYAFGLGYLRSKYREYEARFGKLDNEWHLIYQRSGTFKYVGPVSAKISLAYTFKN